MMEEAAVTPAEKGPSLSCSHGQYKMDPRAAMSPKAVL
jgi:hypothetical protein